MKKSPGPHDESARPANVVFGRVFDLAICVLSVAALVSVLHDPEPAPVLAAAERPAAVDLGDCPASDRQVAALRPVSIGVKNGPCPPARINPSR